MFGAALTGRSINGFEDRGQQGTIDFEELMDVLGRKKQNLMTGQDDLTEFKRTTTKSKRGRKSKY